jgi:hypothetical protein
MNETIIKKRLGMDTTTDIYRITHISSMSYKGFKLKGLTKTSSFEIAKRAGLTPTSG